MHLSKKVTKGSAPSLLGSGGIPDGTMGSLYHEKQVQLLCGVHALNTLLQGPYFTSEDLREIAAEFDQRERDLMKEAGVDSADFMRYMAEDSGNAAVDGNFSIQCSRRRWRYGTWTACP